MNRGRHALRIAISAAVAAAPLFAATAASASAPVTTPQQAGIATLMSSYSDGLIDSSSWWQSAVAQSTVETYQQATGDTSYYQDIVTTYDDWNGSSRPDSLPDFEDAYADDTGWWGLAWMQAYTMTGDSAYLQLAEDDANYIYQHFWDSNGSGCDGAGGGLWWWDDNGTLTGRSTIQNALFLELTSELHETLSGDTKYLGYANAEYSWLSSSGLIQSDGLVWNGWNGACVLTGPYWTYNQGSVIAALAEYSRVTGTAGPLTEAEQIGAAAIADLAPSGVLAETCEPSGCDGDQVSFKGIFVRDLNILAAVAGTSQFASFFQAQAASIEAHDTTSSNQFGLVWSGPTPSCPSALTATNPCNAATQASAEDALVAALSPPIDRPSAVVDTDGTTRVFARTATGSLEVDSLPAGSSTWSGFTSLGGNSPTSPAALAAANGATWVFVTGANGVLYADTLPSGASAWSGWSSLGKPSIDLIGVPAVVEDTSGVIHAFIRSADGDLYTDTYSGSAWSGFSSLGGVWPYDVAAVAGAGGYVHVYATGTTTNMYHDQAPNGGSWSGWANLGGNVSGVPAATQDTGGTLRAYAPDVSLGVLEEFHAAAGSTTYGEDSRGGSWPNDAAAVAGSGGYVDLFDVGSTANVYWQYLTPAPAWSAWINLGGSFTGTPTAVKLSDGAIVLFAASTSGSLEANQLPAGTTTWSGWVGLGGNL